jgi:hypothetical protein
MKLALLRQTGKSCEIIFDFALLVSIGFNTLIRRYFLK